MFGVHISSESGIAWMRRTSTPRGESKTWRGRSSERGNSFIAVPAARRVVRGGDPDKEKSEGALVRKFGETRP